MVTCKIWDFPFFRVRPERLLHKARIHQFRDDRPVKILPDEDNLDHTVAIDRIPILTQILVPAHHLLKLILRHRGEPQTGVLDGFLHSGLLEEVALVLLVRKIAQTLGPDHVLRPLFGDEPVELVDVQRLTAIIDKGPDVIFLDFATLVIVMLVPLVPLVVVLVVVFLVMMVMFMPVMILIVVIVIMISFVALSFDGVDPSRRSSRLIEIEHPGVQKFVKIDVSIVALEDRHFRIQSLHYAADPAKLLGLHLGRLVQKHDVAELDLLDHKILKVILLQIVLLESVPAGELTLHPQSVHNGDYAIEFRNIRLGIFRNKLREGADGLCDRGGLAYSTRLDDDVVELAGAAEVVQLGDKVHFQRAADAAVLERDKAVVRGADNAAFLDEVRVDVHLAYVIDDDGELDAFLVGEYSVDQSCLAAPEVSRQKQHRYFPVFHCYCHGNAVVVILSQNYNIYFGLANRTLADEQVCFVSVVAVLAHEAVLGECFVSVVAVLAHEAMLGECFVSVLTVLAHEAMLGECFVSVLAVLAHEAMLGECFVSVLAVLAHEAWLWGMTTCVMRPLWRAINKRMNFPWNLIGDAS